MKIATAQQLDRTSVALTLVALALIAILILA